MRIIRIRRRVYWSRCGIILRFRRTSLGYGIMVFRRITRVRSDDKFLPFVFDDIHHSVYLSHCLRVVVVYHCLATWYSLLIFDSITSMIDQSADFAFLLLLTTESSLYIFPFLGNTSFHLRCDSMLIQSDYHLCMKRLIS